MFRDGFRPFSVARNGGRPCLARHARPWTKWDGVTKGENFSPEFPCSIPGRSPNILRYQCFQEAPQESRVYVGSVGKYSSTANKSSDPRFMGEVSLLRTLDWRSSSADPHTLLVRVVKGSHSRTLPRCPTEASPSPPKAEKPVGSARVCGYQGCRGWC